MGSSSSCIYVTNKSTVVALSCQQTQGAHQVVFTLQNESTIVALSCQQTRVHDNNDTSCEKVVFMLQTSPL